MDENVMIDYEMQAEQERQMQRDKVESEIRGLVSRLEAPTSDIGDWKIVKCYEASLVGNPMPYDLYDLTQKRQDVRDRINELQDKLKYME